MYCQHNKKYYEVPFNNYDHYIVYQPNYPKIRLGKNMDGGYVLCDMGDIYDICLSCGIERDISFDEAFLEKYPNQVIHGFDGTIGKMPNGKFNQSLFPNQDIWVPVSDSQNEWIQVGNLGHEPGLLHKENYGSPEWGIDKEKFPQHRNIIAVMCPDLEFLINKDRLTWDGIMQKYNNEYMRIPSSEEIRNHLPNNRFQFFRKNISNESGRHTTNLREYFDKYQNIFIKMDIEHWENQFFESLSDEDLTKIKQLVIEFHSTHQFTIPNRLNKTHWLVHMHVNNNEYCKKIHGVNFPNVFECTYIRKEEGVELERNTTPFPIPGLDYPNRPDKKDVPLNGYPFTA
jgi:hypothetical protein